MKSVLTEFKKAPESGAFGWWNVKDSTFDRLIKSLLLYPLS